MWPYCTAMGGRLADSIRERVRPGKIPASWDSPAVSARDVGRAPARTAEKEFERLGAGMGVDEMCRIRYWDSFVAREGVG